MLNHATSDDQWPKRNAKIPKNPARAIPLNINAPPMVAHHIKKNGLDKLVKIRLIMERKLEEFSFEESVRNYIFWIIFC